MIIIGHGVIDGFLGRLIMLHHYFWVIIISVLLVVVTPLHGYHDECACDDTCEWDGVHSDNSCIVILPEGPPLFRPFAADPRQVTFSVGWRFGDQLFNPHTAPVSFGNHLSLFRVYNPLGYCGTLQLELEGGLWALFEHTDRIAPLDNADYYIGFPLVYCIDNWKFRLRGWHLSSHIGDEFLQLHPCFDRRNASAEYVDFFVSYEPGCLRFYGGMGFIVRSDPEFRCKKFYAEYGLETRLDQWGYYFSTSRLWGRPFAAAHFRTRADNDYGFDGTFTFGYEWTKLCGLQRCIRLFGEYHKGYSVEGQFCRLKTDYFAIRLSYGY